MTAPVLTAGLLLLATVASADARCMSKSEARSFYRDTHLYWSYSKDRRRCWANSLARARVLAKVASPAVFRIRSEPTPPPEPQPEPVPQTDPVAWAAEIPKDVVFFSTFISDYPFSVYSTFIGEPPDVWPDLDNKTYTGKLALVFAAAALVGIGLWRLVNTPRRFV